MGTHDTLEIKYATRMEVYYYYVDVSCHYK